MTPLQPKRPDEKLVMSEADASAKDLIEDMKGTTVWDQVRILAHLICANMAFSRQGENFRVAKFQEIDERLAAMESKQKEFGYKGVWRDGEKYQHGNFVTDGGSVWHCEAKDVTSRPGTNGYDWRLAVKKGQVS